MKHQNTHFFLREILGVARAVAIQADADGGRSRSPGADQIRCEAQLERQLIDQPGFLAKEIVKNERMTEAQFSAQEQPSLGPDGRARFLAMKVSPAIFSSSRSRTISATRVGGKIRTAPFVQGWALYGEEMLMRTGFYPDNSAAQGQILRLSRYRAARIGVDVNLHHRQVADHEPARQVSREDGGDFRLGQFHDDLIKNGSMPLSIVQWLLLDDPTAINEVLK